MTETYHHNAVRWLSSGSPTATQYAQCVIWALPSEVGSADFEFALHDGDTTARVSLDREGLSTLRSMLESASERLDAALKE